MCFNIINEIEDMKDRGVCLKIDENEVMEQQTTLETTLRLKTFWNVGDDIVYVSTTKVANAFFETMLFNTDLNLGEFDDMDELSKSIDWDSEYGVYRTTDIIEATENHLKVVAMLKELNERLKNERLNELKGIFMSTVSIIKELIK